MRRPAGPTRAHVAPSRQQPGPLRSARHTSAWDLSIDQRQNGPRQCNQHKLDDRFTNTHATPRSLELLILSLPPDFWAASSNMRVRKIKKTIRWARPQIARKCAARSSVPRLSGFPLWHFLCATQCLLWLKVCTCWLSDQKALPQRTQSLTEEMPQRTPKTPRCVTFLSRA